MPCFKGIAVSIHANSAPLNEFGLQKQSRLSRISTYIPVPQPQLNSDTGKHEAAKFAISITLLTPGHPIPYSAPKPSATNPYPKSLYAGSLPSTSSDPSKHANAIVPYIPMTNSENETIAAYIYFDGRAKEEVATLLRPGEETWVNSRWVQVPESEGGGLAEREFLFREVGLERWLNGLDLKGHDAAEKVEKRRQKFERRHRRQKSTSQSGGTDLEKPNRARDALAYGADEQSPLGSPDGSDDDSMSDDDEPPEATGQIKVAMFRVIASGEIKKGEYSPQFDAHDDDDESDGGNKGGNSGTIDADVEHTTSFAKPKTLDPKTISTQTVTGIDGPEKPYAVFTFFYRGQRQLSKMGLDPSAKDTQKTPAGKRRSTQLDFSGLGPLKSTGTVGFSAFRDQDAEAAKRRKARRKSNGHAGAEMDEDSEDDDDVDDPLAKMEDTDDKIVKTHLAPEDAKVTGELQAGIDRIRLKRQHSADPDSAAGSSYQKSPSTDPTNAGEATPTETTQNDRPVPDSVSNLLSKAFNEESTVGSPLKKQRAGDDSQDRSANFPSALGDVLASASADQQQKQAQQPMVKDEKDDEEL
ncbi:Uu.00g124280.m01.CDS01 [Anthostomella pinea]|uniref:Uu.00g124280.m01.CDS01 n=1 Tax=Anthostomella pinea TaxID=933095 RepID=A0AAI8VIK8_9PEZI|nr:Uu.00g124280.m01.CDS01 [Anthostomella pinea]